ncbi:MAG: molecular chaperone HtpG, partial [Nitrospinae bacterium]|nr:molecular chaperone HtpG [Nitrospinota bacterium]
KKDEEKYLKFWTQFGTVLKEGIFEDTENKDILLDLTLCASTNDSEALTSLKDYVDRMKPEQEAIYYITGESRAAVENSPHLEAFQDKGYEVLLFTDPVDDVWLQSTNEYDGKTLQSVSKGAVDLGTEDEKKKDEAQRKEHEETYGSLLERLQKELADEVKEVRLSKRLTNSAACLVGEAGDMSPHMEKLMSAMGTGAPASKRVLELNPNHPVLEKLGVLFEKDADTPEISDYAQLLYGQALLAEGSPLADPGKFAQQVANLMANAL